MTFKKTIAIVYVCLSMSSQAAAQHLDLFSIEPSEVEEPSEKSTAGDGKALLLLLDDTEPESQSHKADQSLSYEPRPKPTMPIRSEALDHELFGERHDLSDTSREGFSKLAAYEVIDAWEDGRVHDVLPPSWLATQKEKGYLTSPELPDYEYLQGWGFTWDNYFVMDELYGSDVIARYYFKVVDEGGLYFEPADDFNPVTGKVTPWQKVTVKVDKKPSPPPTPFVSNTPRQDYVPKFKPKSFAFGDIPLSEDTQEWLDLSKNLRENVYEKRQVCRQVEDSDTVFIRYKTVCEEKDVFVGTRPVQQ